MEIISIEKRTARKERLCDLCECKINKGTKYIRQFNKEGNDCYTFNCHQECMDLISTDIFDGETEVSCDLLVESIQEYVRSNHYDEEIDDIENGWQLNNYDIVKKIIAELKEESK